MTQVLPDLKVMQSLYEAHEPLLSAAMNGDVAGVEAALAAGAMISDRRYWVVTKCAEYGLAEVAADLLVRDNNRCRLREWYLVHRLDAGLLRAPYNDYGLQSRIPHDRILHLPLTIASLKASWWKMEDIVANITTARAAVVVMKYHPSPETVLAALAGKKRQLALDAWAFGEK